MKEFFVYILASKRNGTLYIGVTSNLPKRIYEHKNKLSKGFTEKHNIDKLVYYEPCQNAEAAILREKRLKKYKRVQKMKLIETDNPEWKDLYNKLF